MTEKIAKITHVSLGYEDHGIFTCALQVDYGGSGQSVGSYVLGGVSGIDYIKRTMKACGVDEWSKIKGRTILVLTESDNYNARVVGIKPLPTEPGEAFLFDEWVKEHADERA